MNLRRQLILKRSRASLTKLSASGAAAVNDDFYDLPGGNRASAPGQGWPMVRVVSKNRENKGYGPESAKLGWALPARG